jgi:hypothetical protein
MKNEEKTKKHVQWSDMDLVDWFLAIDVCRA